MLRTKLCDVLNIDYPIIQGGMAWVATAELAAAVSNAGGLGIIGAGNAPGEFVKEQVKRARSLTKRPFGVNVMLLSPFAEDVMQVVYEEKVPVITTGAGNPGKYVDKLKDVGIKVLPVVPSVALAKRMERDGVDAVIAEGTESGGHVGELTTMTLVPQVVDAIDIPVVAAGGIADGRGLVAALALGADGIQMGTRFVTSKECTVNQKYKDAIVKAKDRDAVVTGRSTGHPVRVLKNELTREYGKLEKQHVETEILEKLGTGKLKAAAIDGDVKQGSVMSGQIAGMIHDIKPCKQIIDDIMNEADGLLDRIKEWR